MKHVKSIEKTNPQFQTFLVCNFASSFNDTLVLPRDVIAMAASSTHQESRSLIRYERDSEHTGYGRIGIYWVEIVEDDKSSQCASSYQLDKNPFQMAHTQ
jgi:hypothetical protein